MILPEYDLTSLTQHPQWKTLAAIINGMQDSEIAQLKRTIDPVGNQRLILLTTIKTRLANLSKNKELWNV